MKKPPSTETTATATSAQRLRVFKFLAALFPLALLLLLEGALRVFGYGHDLRLFVEDENNRAHWVMNRHASKRYFTQADNATVGNQEPFRKRKDARTYRIFVLGESTTIGYPYLHNGSFHRWLQYRLLHTFPDKHFEIINLSLTAVNSYTVRGFGREMADYEPDAVLIYTGHNEYYGALGVGSTSYVGNSPSLVRLVLELRSFRVVQLAQNAFHALRSLLTGERVDLRENLMKRMAAEQQIPLQSEAYQRGIRQFETNLDDLCQLLAQRRIPVFISNLVSNERDLKPFISAPANAPASAAGAFGRANQAYARGDFRGAKQGYVRAKELDLLRFRAPEAINGVIKKLADRHPNVHLVDARTTFEQHTPHGILGKETLLEHVHPNLYGYALLSDAFYRALRQQKCIRAAWPPEVPFDRLLRQMPITEVDSLRGVYEVMMLKEGWPFNEPLPSGFQRGNRLEEQLAGALSVKQLSWGAAMDQLLTHYLKENNQPKALEVTLALLLEHPHDPAPYAQAGKLAMNLGDNEQAAFYLTKAFQLLNDFDTAKNLFITLLKLDRPDEALVYLNYAAAHNPSVNLSDLQTLVNQLIGLKGQYDRDSTDASLANRVAAGYLRFANATAAAKYVDKSLRLEPRNEAALQLRKQIQQIEK